MAFLDSSDGRLVSLPAIIGRVIPSLPELAREMSSQNPRDEVDGRLCIINLLLMLLL